MVSYATFYIILLFSVYYRNVNGNVEQSEIQQDACSILVSSRFAKLIPRQINASLREAAVLSMTDAQQEPWYTTREHEERNLLVKQMVHDRFPYQLCNDSLYSPSIERLSEVYSCEKICRMCFPGSISICLLRNVKFLSMGETCLCTYSTENPIGDAAFSLRHEKRVFSRRM